MQADELCKQSSMQIVGYYQANELANDLDLGPFGKRISEKIRSRCPLAATLLVRQLLTRRCAIDPKPLRPAWLPYDTNAFLHVCRFRVGLYRSWMAPRCTPPSTT